MAGFTPSGCHQGADVVILNSTSQIQPAEPSWGKGTPHAAMLGTATYISLTINCFQLFTDILSIDNKIDEIDK